MSQLAVCGLDSWAENMTSPSTHCTYPLGGTIYKMGSSLRTQHRPPLRLSLHPALLSAAIGKTVHTNAVFQQL